MSQGSKAAAQTKWLNKPQNRFHFRRPENVQRVQRWRERHPGYWRKKRSSRANALQDLAPTGLTNLANYETQLFNEPFGFLSYATCHSVAVAVIDIWMPGMSGLEVKKELQAVSPKTRVIIITANVDESARNEVIRAGAIAVFIKPFDTEDFLAAMYQALASAT